MSEITEKIKEKLDIVEFLKSYLELKPAGKNFRALCPFHKEKTPSFMVSPDRQSWHCFGGCNEGGDVFKFLMKHDNLEFYEALKILADRSGIVLKQLPGAADFHQYEILYEINNAAKDFWQGLLRPSAGGARNDSEMAWKYLLERGLKKEIIDEFELGFAPARNAMYSVAGGPDSYDQLTCHLIDLGFKVQDIERAGLAFKTDRGNYWDRFRGRIMFPIYNAFGKVVGFTGRILDNSSLRADPPTGGEAKQSEKIATPTTEVGARNDGKGFIAAKYINSPETPIFNKSRILYGLHKAKKYIREQKLALLVEGQMDFLMAYQDNIKNVVATSGTALTDSHLQVLRKMADKLILSFDSDEAGLKATERSIDLAAANDFMVKVLTIIGSKDPAEIVRKQSGELIKIIGTAQPAMNFYFNRYLSPSLPSHQQKNNIRIILAKVKNVFSDIEQATWLKELSNRTGINETALVGEMSKIPKISLEKRLPHQTFGNHDPKSLIRNDVDDHWSRKQLIMQRILDLGGQLPPGVMMAADTTELMLKASLENSRIEPSQCDQELAALTRQLKIETFKEKQQLLRRSIIQAEQENREEDIKKNLAEFDTISKEFHNLLDHGQEKLTQEKGGSQKAAS